MVGRLHYVAVVVVFVVDEFERQSCGMSGKKSQGNAYKFRYFDHKMDSQN